MADLARCDEIQSVHLAEALHTHLHLRLTPQRKCRGRPKLMLS
ncbi:MAG TPA: hypothetical protein VK249_07355 [Anaerolineales bacterium]|nr:hypothetical protein [Anaerolineales bacterium]